MILAPTKFPLGQVVATPGAIEAMKSEGADAGGLLARHGAGDWGEVCAEDKKANEAALKHEARLMSAYTLPKTGAKLWVITEADKSATTLLLPDEY